MNLPEVTEVGHGYLLVLQKIQVCNCFLCAKPTRVDPVLKRLCCLCAFDYRENLFLSFEVELQSPVLQLTNYMSISTPHKHTTHSQVQAQAHHTAGF